MPRSIHRVALARRDEDENFLRNSSHPIVYPGSDEIINKAAGASGLALALNQSLSSQITSTTSVFFSAEPRS